MNGSKWKRGLALLAAMMVLAAACGGSSGADTAEEVGQAVEAAPAPGEEPESTVDASASDDEPATDSEADDGEGEIGQELVVVDPSDGPTTEVTLSALGGVTMSYPAELSLLHLEDTVLVHPTDADPNAAVVFLALVSQNSSGAQVTTLEEYLEAVTLTHTAEPTGTAVSFGGYELAGFDITGSTDLQVFANTRFPAPSLSAGGPNKFSRTFAVDTPSGVLTVGIGGSSQEAAEQLLPALGTVLGSFEFVGPGLDNGLPAGEAIEPEDAGAPPPPAEADDIGDPALGAPFSPASPGRHELLNFGLPISVEFDDGWFVQPNFPGVVVLTHPDSVGPNDRDVVFLNSLRELLPVAAGPVRAGEAIDVDDIDALLESPPAGLAVDNIDRFELLSQNGSSTTRVIAFDVASAAGSTCSPSDPCDFAFVTTYGFVKTVRSVDAGRVWWFPDHPNGPAAAFAAAPASAADWLAEAEELMSTLELAR